MVLVEVDGDSLVEVAEHLQLRAFDVAASDEGFKRVVAVHVVAFAVHADPDHRRSFVALVAFGEFLGLVDDPFDFLAGEVSEVGRLARELCAVGWCRCHFVLWLAYVDRDTPSFDFLQAFFNLFFHPVFCGD